VPDCILIFFIPIIFKLFCVKMSIFRHPALDGWTSEATVPIFLCGKSGFRQPVLSLKFSNFLHWIVRRYCQLFQF
jgi:hypothetical protein